MATPALAQDGTKARSNPGVQVLKSVKGFNASRASLKKKGSSAVSRLEAARTAKGAQIDRDLDTLGVMVDGIAGGARETLGQLDGKVKSGKTKEARDLATRIAGHARSAQGHQRAARAAHAKGDVKAFRAELDALEVDLRAIERSSKQLGLIEPVIHR